MAAESVRAFLGGLLKVSIRTKIMGIVAVCVLWASFALVWQEYHNVSAALKQELTQRGVAIGTSLATQSVEPILTDRQFTLHRLVRDTIDVDPDLIYAFVVDKDGDYLVHTFNGGFPADLTHPEDRAIPGPYDVQLLNSGDDTIQDIAVSIQGGRLGEVHVGMSESAIDSRIEEHVRTILIWAGLILALGLALAYGMSVETPGLGQGRDRQPGTRLQ
jgi:sensor histidine kinase regulating citrate/malate metabolism